MLDQARNKKMWQLTRTYLGHDKESIQKQIVAHIEYTGARSRFSFDLHTCCLAVAASLKDRLIECYNDTMQQWNLQQAKRVYIFSPTCSLGKRIQSVLINLNLELAYKEALAELGLDL